MTIASQQGANISAGLLAPTQNINTFSQVCLSGRTSGKICGTYAGNGGTTPREHITNVAAQPGDSGAPLYTPAGELVGIVATGGSGVGSYSGDVRDASSYALAQGWVGGGFQPIG